MNHCYGTFLCVLSDLRLSMRERAFTRARVDSLFLSFFLSLFSLFFSPLSSSLLMSFVLLAAKCIRGCARSLREHRVISANGFLAAGKNRVNDGGEKFNRIAIACAE